MTFEDEALHRLARLAAKEQTGARALVSVCERALLKFEKSLPSTDIRSLRVTKAVVENPEVELQKLLVRQGTAAYVDSFRKTYGIELAFEDDALVLLAETTTGEGVSISDLCHRWFDDYGHGLKLLGRTTFTITRSAAESPKGHMDELIKAFYSRREA